MPKAGCIYPTSGSPSTVLVLHPGAIGDVLLSLPALREIKTKLRTVVIHLAAKGNVAMFLKEVGIVEEASDIESSFYLSLYSDTFSEQLIEFIRSFQRVYLFTINTTSGLVRQLRGPARDFKVVHTISDKAHVASYRVRQINSSVNSITPIRLMFPESFSSRAIERLKGIGYQHQNPLVVIHPGSGSVDKNVSLETFFSLADYLIEKKGCFVLYLTGHAEHQGLIEEVTYYVANREGKAGHFNSIPLMAVASILGLAYMYIGNDSGISHLASLCVDRLIVFFRGSNPELWSPIGVDVKVVTADYRDKALQYIDQFMGIIHSPVKVLS